MIVYCAKCEVWFEDVYRSTVCPHAAFPANDGNNNFRVHNDAYLSTEPPMSARAVEVLPNESWQVKPEVYEEAD